MSYVGNTNTTQAFTPAIDYFSGNGSTVAFTLSRPVASVAQVQVVVNNVAQNPSTAFTVSGNTITFTGAPSSGTNNIYVQYTSPITQVIAPGQGTVGATQLVDGSITPAKMSSGAPSWSALGGVSLPRIDSSSEGGQLNLNRASDDTSAWSVDVYGSTSTPSLRFVDNVAGAARMSIDGSGRVTMPYQPMACFGWKADQAKNTVIGSTSQYTILNTGSYLNTSTGRFTCPVAGRYRATFTGMNNAATQGFVRCRLNAATISGSGDTATSYTPATTYARHCIDIILTCAANDVIDFFALDGSYSGIHSEYGQVTFELIG